MNAARGGWLGTIAIAIGLDVGVEGGAEGVGREARSAAVAGAFVGDVGAAAVGQDRDAPEEVVFDFDRGVGGVRRESIGVTPFVFAQTRVGAMLSGVIAIAFGARPRAAGSPAPTAFVASVDRPHVVAGAVGDVGAGPVGRHRDRVGWSPTSSVGPAVLVARSIGDDAFVVAVVDVT